MSTKSTIRSGQRFHLYRDYLDECGGATIVHLRVEGVHFEAYAGGTVILDLPQALAIEIGIPLERAVKPAATSSDLFVALKALVENPRPDMGDAEIPTDWSVRFARYSEAYDAAAALLAKTEGLR